MWNGSVILFLERGRGYKTTYDTVNKKSTNYGWVRREWNWTLIYTRHHIGKQNLWWINEFKWSNLPINNDLARSHGWTVAKNKMKWNEINKYINNKVNNENYRFYISPKTYKSFFPFFLFSFFCQFQFTVLDLIPLNLDLL